MRKAIGIIAVVLLGATLLAGCGEEASGQGGVTVVDKEGSLVAGEDKNSGKEPTTDTDREPIEGIHVELKGKTLRIYGTGEVTVEDLMTFMMTNRGAAFDKIVFEEGITSISGLHQLAVSGLKDIEFPESLVEIDRSFLKCELAKEKDGFTVLGSILLKAEDATEIIVPEGITVIAADAFEGCKSTEKLVLPEGCKIKNVSEIISTGVEIDWGVKAENGFVVVNGILVKSESVSGNVVIPSNVTEIADKVFYECAELTGIEFPSGVTKIGRHAFKGCTGLTSVELPSGLRSIGTGAFVDCTGLTGIEIPGTVKEIGKTAFYRCTGLTEVKLAEGIPTISDSMFGICSSLTGVVIPGSVTEIGEGAFADCAALVSVEMQDGITRVGTDAFRGCEALTSVKLSNTLESIDGKAFYECIALTSLELPGSVKSIGYAAFFRCKSLENIIIPESVQWIDDEAFKNCDKLTIAGKSGSYAETYATEKGISFVAQ